jgi:hypothetical protein
MASGIKSAKLKLSRAAIHLREIKRCIATYSAGKPHKIITKAKRKKKVHIHTAPSREISILVGEMVYQMRSALDHLAFDLVKLNPRIDTIAPKWREKCQFPTRIKLPRGRTAPLLESDFAQDLPGISTGAFTFIESIQPYYGRGKTRRCLRFLDELSNIDKHRHFNIIGPHVQKSERIRFEGGLSISSREMLDHGAEIYMFPPWLELGRTVNVQRTFRTSVHFDERDVFGDAVIVPVQKLLQFILDELKTTVIPTLEKFINKP